MNRKQVIKSLIIVPLLAALVAFAGSQYGQHSNAIPIYAICIAFAFVFNWLAFIPAFKMQTEKFFDLVGSATYIITIIMACTLVSESDNRTLLVSVLIIIWALRLGSFLYKRIHKAGKDDRFDTIKPDGLRFFNVWTIQALWVTLTTAPALMAITSTVRKELGLFALIGFIIWLIGFVIEVIADNQKTKFKADPSNAGKFISTGLWAKSRHPNYFGEILLWIGMFIICLPVLRGWHLVSIISPIFVYLLLTKISGVPGLEAKAEKKWGGEEGYERYKKETPLLIPKI